VDQYIWDDTLVDLSNGNEAVITCGFMAPGAETEVIFGFSGDRKTWGESGDALTMYAATHRADFSFRTNVFGDWPEVTHHSGIYLETGKWYDFQLNLSSTWAEYFIDDHLVASVNLQPGEVAE